MVDIAVLNDKWAYWIGGLLILQNQSQIIRKNLELSNKPASWLEPRDYDETTTELVIISPWLVNSVHLVLHWSNCQVLPTVVCNFKALLSRLTYKFIDIPCVVPHVDTLWILFHQLNHFEEKEKFIFLKDKCWWVKIIDYGLSNQPTKREISIETIWRSSIFKVHLVSLELSKRA